VIAELFKPLEIECLVRTAVELWEQADTTGLSEPQQDVPAPSCERAFMTEPNERY
jgi:hypothetical protein